LYSDAGLTTAIAVNGTVAASANAATVYFVPNANFNGTPTFQYAAIDNNGAQDATPATATITVTAVNDPPTLTATALNPTFTEGGTSGQSVQAAPVSVFSNGNVSTIESGQTITALTLTVGGLRDGSNERISIDGSAITLGANSSGTTATNGMSYSVSITSGTATISLTRATGISASAANTLVNGVTYQDTNIDNPTAG